MKPAPIVLFTYNRPAHVRQTVEALKKNQLAEQSSLMVYSDGPKGKDDLAKVADVRKYIHNIDGFRSVEVIERAENLGLGESIINGVTEVVNKYGRVIVMEDDLVTSPFFLRYINKGLELYESEEKVISIHGYIYPVQGKLPSTFFLRGADCLGWATWKRGWDLFEKNGSKLLNELRSRKLTKEFDFNGAFRYTRMLKEQAAGRNSSWAIRWYASAFLKERITLYPGVSLVRHIGNDGTGTNFGISDTLNVELAKEPVFADRIDNVENPQAAKLVEIYLRSVKIPFIKAITKHGKRRLVNFLQFA
jgi:hypothetical protein